MRKFLALFVFFVIILSILESWVGAAACDCIPMSGSGCRGWASSGTGFYWVTDSEPSSCITLTAGPCGGAGESGTAYIYMYLNASAGQCEYPSTACGGQDFCYGRYAKIKVIGSRQAFKHIFPDGLSFKGCFSYGSPLSYKGITITEANTECDLPLSCSQVNRIVLNAQVAQCDGAYDGSKFTIQIKFYEARDSGQSQFTMLDAVTGSLTVVNNAKTSFDPENFIPDVREGTVVGWIEKTTHNLSDQTTDNRWKVRYKTAGGCQQTTEGVKLAPTEPPYTLIPSSHTVYRVKLPGFKRDMHGLPGYAAEGGWSYVLQSGSSYIQYQGQGHKIIFHCDSPADNDPANKRYLIRRVETCNAQQNPGQGDNKWYVYYTYNSPAKINLIHNGSNPNDPNTVNSATVQYAYEWDGNQANVSYKTRPTIGDLWPSQPQRQWQVEFDAQDRATKYDAGCSSGCSGSGEFENVTYLDPSEFNLTGYEYLIKEKKNADGVTILQNTYDVIDFGEWVPAYWLYLTNAGFGLPSVTGCEYQTESDDIPGWAIGSPTQEPYCQLCDNSGDQSVRPNGHTIEKEFPCYLSPQTQYKLTVRIMADVDAQHTSSATAELLYDTGFTWESLGLISVTEQSGQLVQGQWGSFEADISCPEGITELTQTDFALRVGGNYVYIDEVQLSGSIWVPGSSRPILVEQKVYDENANPPGLKTAMTRSYDMDNFIVTETRYLSQTDYRLTKYYYTDRTFSELDHTIEYKELSGDALGGESFTTTYEVQDTSADPNVPYDFISTTTWPSGKRADVQTTAITGPDDDKTMTVVSSVVDLDTDANSLRQTWEYEQFFIHDPVSGKSTYEYKPTLHTNTRGGVTDYTYEGIVGSSIYLYLLKTETGPATRAGTQQISYTYDIARRVIAETRKLDSQRTLATLYIYDPNTGFLDSMTINGAATHYYYNSFGQVIREVTPDGVVTGKSYGLGGELLSEFVISDNTADPNSADTSLTLISQTRYTYTADGQIEWMGKYKVDGEFSYQANMTANPDNWIVTKYEYYPDGKRKKVIEDYGTGRANLTTEYFYNLQGEIEKVLYPTGKWIKTSRDGRGLVILEETGYGSSTVVLQTAYDYDANGNLIEQVNPDGSTLIYTYDNYDRLKRIYKGSLSGPYTENFYNDAGDVIREIAVDNGGMLSDTRMDYDAVGQLIYEWVCAEPNNPSGIDDLVTHYQYDIAGNLRKQIRAGLMNADPNENPDPNDIVTEYVYNDQGRRGETIDPKGIHYSVEYTDAGLVKKTISPIDPYDPNAFITENSYAYGRLLNTVDPMGHTTVNLYNSLNQLTKQVVFDCNDTPAETGDDFAVRQRRFEYDNLGNITRQAVMADAESSSAITPGVDLVTDFVYENGLLYQQKTYVGTNAVPAVTTYYYDSIDRKQRTVDPEDNEEIITYYTDGQRNALVQKVEQKQVDSDNPQAFYTVTTFFEYDNLGRLFKKILDTDGDGIKETTDQTTTYTYDGLDRIQTETAHNGVETFYAYDGFGNVSVRVEDYDDGQPDIAHDRTTEFVYNRLNQQEQVIAYDPNDTTSHIAAQITSYEYDKNGNVIKIIYPDEFFVQYEYNLLNKVGIETKRDGTEIFYGYWYSGNLWFESDDPDGPYGYPTLLTEFEYDGTGALVYAYKEIDYSEVSESSFAYNGFGARTSETVRYGDCLSKTTVWTYDGSGNQTSQTHGDTILTYTHDGLGRIKTIDKGENEIVYYAYIGRNTKSIDYTQAQTSQSFGYDALGRIEQCLSIDLDEQTILDFQYTYNTVGLRDTCKYNHLTTPVWDVYEYDNLRRLEKVTYADADGYVAFATEGTENTENVIPNPALRDEESIQSSRNLAFLADMASKWLERETADYADYTDLFATETTVIHRENKNPINPVILSKKPVNPVKEYSAAEVEEIKRRILSILKTVKDPHIAKLIQSVKSVESAVYDPDAPLLTLVEFGDDIPNNYTAETCRDEEGVIIAQIIYDNHDRIVLFALYPGSGGTVVISTSYDNQGNITSNTLMFLDENDTVTETVDMLAQEKQSTDYTDFNDYSSDSSAITVAQMESLDGGGMMLMSSTPEAPASAAEIFDYDHLCNRYQYTNKDGYTTTYTHNPINQYSRSVMVLPYVGEVEVTPLYDDNGNLSADGEGYTYLYDYQNRLTEIEDVVQFKYDALGRRFYKKDLTTNAETYYFFDTNNRIIAQYVKPQNETEELDRSFVYGNGPHEVLAMFLAEYEGSDEDWQEFLDFCEAWLSDPNDANWNGSFDVVDDDRINLKDFAYFASQWNLPSSYETEWYYLHDAQGSVMGLIGARLNRPEDREFYTYDVYGTPSSHSAIGNPFMFHGKFVASTMPLIYSRFYRDYTPDLGTWLQFEKLGIVPNDILGDNPFNPIEQYKEGANLYIGLGDNPVMSIDSKGLNVISITMNATRSVIELERQIIRQKASEYSRNNKESWGVSNQCADQNYKLLTYIKNGSPRGIYYWGFDVRGGSKYGLLIPAGDTFAGFGYPANHSVLYVIPNDIARTFGYSPFVLDAYRNVPWSVLCKCGIKKDIKESTPHEFERKYPYDQGESFVPYLLDIFFSK